MKAIYIFQYEFKHFARNKAKVFAYVLFVMASVYALHIGYDLHSKQQETIQIIEQKKQEGIADVLSWFEGGKTGPEDRPWVDITKPFWALWYAPTYAIKTPSPLLPLGIGQAEQYGYYKKVTFWSSTCDNDMVEELANPERLINGNIDFGFLILFLLPILLIILTYNINGLEKDQKFDKLISIQAGNTTQWILARLLFYLLLISFTVSVLMVSAGIAIPLGDDKRNLVSLVLLAIGYVLFWSLINYAIIRSSKGSSWQAFLMISVWLLLCVVIPGAVHQYASVKYPANLMTDYLDVNRKEANKVWSLSDEERAEAIVAVFPDLRQTVHGKDTVVDAEIVSNSESAIINQLNKKAIDKIEQQNDAKNNLIISTYWFNPVCYFQNKWDSLTETDYNSYKLFRADVQNIIDKKIELLAFECWNKIKTDKSTYENYLKLLKK